MGWVTNDPPQPEFSGELLVIALTIPGTVVGLVRVGRSITVMVCDLHARVGTEESTIGLEEVGCTAIARNGSIVVIIHPMLIRHICNLLSCLHLSLFLELKTHYEFSFNLMTQGNN